MVNVILVNMLSLVMVMMWCCAFETSNCSVGGVGVKVVMMELMLEMMICFVVVIVF